jgi:DNA primase
MIDQNTINRIFETADIVEVISEFVQLKKSGTNYKGLSPFSNEKTPSFMVSPSKGIFKDFSSGKGGNVVGFLMEHEKLSYPEALRYLAKKYNIEIFEKEKTPEDIQQENERESLLVVTAFAQKYFTDKLQLNAEGKAIGLKYLKERGVREDIIEKFQLGYSPEERDALSLEAQKKGFKTDYLVKSGLSVERNGKFYDRFSGRVIFPIHSLPGTVIGFGGRTLRSDKETAKYLNSPESEIYHKSRVLYGLFQAKKAIVNSERCYLVEGYTDVLSFHQAGIENVVSSSGTALTVEQIRLIKRFTPNITIIYDGDEAGIKASFRGIDLILEEGLNLKVLLLPDGEDPDSFSKKHSSTELKEFIGKNERDFISFKTNLLLKDAEKDPVKKANLITDIVRTISVIPENINRSVYIKECSTLLNIDENVLYSEVNKNRGRNIDQKFRSERRPPDPDFQEIPSQPQLPSFVEDVYSEYEEREIIYFLLKFGDEMLNIPAKKEAEISVSEYIIREIQNENLEFKNLIYKKVFEDVSALLEKGLKIDEKYFVFHEDKKVQELAVEIYTSRYELSKIWMRKDTRIDIPGENLGNDIPKALLTYKNRIITNAIQDLHEKINELYSKGDENNDIRGLQIKYKKLKDINILISKELGERIMNY